MNNNDEKKESLSPEAPPEQDSIKFKPENISRLIGRLLTEPTEHKNPDGTISHRFAVSDTNGVSYAVNLPTSPHTKNIDKTTPVGTIIDMTGNWKTHAIKSEGKNSEIPVFHPVRAVSRPRMPGLIEQLSRNLDKIMDNSPESPVLVSETEKKDPRTPSFDPIPSIETVISAEKRIKEREEQNKNKEEEKKEEKEKESKEEKEKKEETEKEQKTHTEKKEEKEDVQKKEQPEEPKRNTYLVSGRIKTEPEKDEKNPNIISFYIENERFKNKTEKVVIDLTKTDALPFEKEKLMEAKINEKIDMIGSWHRSHDKYVFKPIQFVTEQSQEEWKKNSGKEKKMQESNSEMPEPKKTRKRYNTKKNENGLD